jgi:hypothetical protein
MPDDFACQGENAGTQWVNMHYDKEYHGLVLTSK